MYKFKADVAVLLNITPDHLDRYDFKMQNYTDSKMRIIQNQTENDAFVYWNDDPVVTVELPKYNLKAQKVAFADKVEDGCQGYADGKTVTIKGKSPFSIAQSDLALMGRHNVYNQLAAALACNYAGVPNEFIIKGLKEFKGVEHRLEYVDTKNGVRFINDSKATNVDACFFALESMKTKTVLIIGGKDKGNDYNAIMDLVKEKCSGLVYLGADNKKLHDNFDKLGMPVRDTHSMKDCVAACVELAEPGATVLLSPCCASFDLFKNMEDRGEQFKELVRSL